MTNLEYIRTCTKEELVDLLCVELNTDCYCCVAREYCYNEHTGFRHTGFIDWLDEERGEGE